MTGQSKKLLSVDLGRTDYKSTWELQKKLVDLRHKGDIPDILLFTEHNPVITMGRASSSKNLLCTPEQLKEKNVELYEIERGGDVTFHGPGQTPGEFLDSNARCGVILIWTRRGEE